MIEVADDPQGSNFVNLVHHLKKKKAPRLREVSNLLIQFAQLRNAIVHDETNVGEVIAEPHVWTVQKIEEIEKFLLEPDKVFPKFSRKADVLDASMKVRTFLQHVLQNRYTFYPIGDKANYLGILTLKSVALYTSEVLLTGKPEMDDLTIRDLINRKEKRSIASFVSKDANTDDCKQLFKQSPNLEVLFITENGEPNRRILGVIRPSDLFQREF
jgi:hypothetical protein